MKATTSIIAGAGALLLSAAANAADISVISTQAKALVKFLTAPAAAAVIRKHGLEPA